MPPSHAGHLGQSGVIAADHFSAGDRLAACLVCAVAAFGAQLDLTSHSVGEMQHDCTEEIARWLLVLGPYSIEIAGK